MGGCCGTSIPHIQALDAMLRRVDGGRFRRIDLGANWWATTRWKFGFAYGNVRLDRDGLRGHTNTFLTRAQWIY